ncbi:flavodoxin-dependent (E)-4-hydroxy-3-methylbut-2-enyl-diphosphate synthase [Halanaerobiaceae bacterium Z-7014]|uniref:4-hydroxy-3-methylbut-2-en-1-yl diphosphate synthase (flavodoxin) n=1 Tax=Halonatronomonas betaini TaxID=2778430 RepID=A0A931APR8_9FIRM|nr:flavodoxin-dependent (E)-4-hydroxy-3-methylbut-2-enyl-diphosphate synthase [Halonatronomonas betaini]MBF8436672.1 flavodoxin-dependent (E)-4-hydroxy-3-methylbut-2-enyl-diphosphate synthase [Halonatronomonas betaini]
MIRRNAKAVNLGDLKIGGDAPISIQSMTNTKTVDIEATITQIKELSTAGCEIIRVAVPDSESVNALPEIIQDSPIPVIADIHFDYRLALGAIEAGIDGLRLNPGNIGGFDRVKQVVNASKEAGIPIRVGVNSGSLDEEIAKKYGHSAEAMVASASKHINYLEKLNFTDIIVSLKSSSIMMTLEANQLFAEKYDYPLHIGITEAGSGRAGDIKSAAGIGALLSHGLGDTLRISLTDDPVREVEAGIEILKSFGMRDKGIEIISCPTCGRTEIDLLKLSRDVKAALKGSDLNLTVAVMGCAVNGPGEASQADIGIAGGKGVGLIFKKGEIIKKVSEDELLDELITEIKKMECE